MESKRLYYIGGGMLALMLVATWFGYRAVRSVPPGGFVPVKETISSAQPPVPAKPEVHVYKKDSRTIVVTWANLPAGTTELDVFRSLLKGGKWTRWKTISISENGSNGSAELTLGKNENADNYIFQIQAVTHQGNGATSAGGGSGDVVLWTSQSGSAEDIPPGGIPGSSPPPAPPGSPAPTPSPTSTPSPAPAPSSSPPAPSPAPTPPPPPAPTPSPGQSTSVIYYYTPSGGVSGTSSNPIVGNFWIQHVNKFIDINWQNLPLDTDKAILSRSTSQNGPWLQLLAQQNPVTVGPYSIRLIDSTANDPNPFYYKLEAYRVSTLLVTYGPVELQPE